MRLHSTPESVRAPIPSVLALIETLAAISVSIFIAIYFETLLHIVMGSCVAPLLLLRSDASVAMGRQLFQKTLPRPWDELHNFYKIYSKGENRLAIGTYYVIGNVSRHLQILFMALITKLVSTLAHPIAGLKTLPTNWYRVVCCIDSRSAVELVPDTGTVNEILIRVELEDKRDLLFSSLATMLFPMTVLVAVTGLILFSTVLEIVSEFWGGVYIMLIASLPSLLLWTAPAIKVLCYTTGYLYRFSLKSTALLWLPLLYVTQLTFDEKLSINARLHEVKYTALWRLIRLLSWATLALLLAKIIILPNVIDWWNSLRFADVFDIYVMHNQIHPWHVAAGINALIALLGYYLFIDRASLYIKEGKWSDAGVSTGMQVFFFIRGILSIYTITVGIYLTWVAAAKMHWPDVSMDPFPW